MEEKRILLYGSGNIIDTKQTGGVKRFLELCEFLLKRDIKINNIKVSADLCCGDDNDALENKGLNAKYHMDATNTDKKNYILPPEAKILIKNSSKIKQIKKQKYDFVIVFDVPPAIGLCILGVKNIALMIRKDMIGYEMSKSEKNHDIRYILKIIMQWVCEDIVLKKSKIIVCQCYYDKRVLIDRHKHLKSQINDKTHILINNVNPSWIVNNSNIKIKQEKKKEEIFIVGFIGEFSDLRKGQDIFLKAAQYLVKKYKHQIKFVLIGDGIFLSDYRKKYKSKHIHFVGHMDNPIVELKDLDLLVVPSLADSCPNTVLEGIYNGVPVIGSNAGGIPELLNNRNVIFEPKPADLIKMIDYYYSDRDKLMQVKKQQEIRKNELSFDWGDAITRVILEQSIC